jgi:putative aldouronate transport system substrate-binding protein
MKRKLCFLVALLLAAVVFAGGKKEEPVTGAAGSTTTTASQVLDKGKTRGGGMPIVQSPVELEVAYVFATNYGDPNKYVVWDQLAKDTGIKFKFRVLNNAQNLNLMWAAQDYPDLGFFNAVPSNNVWDTAVQAGDIINLKPYLDAGLAPNFTKFFNEFPVYKAVSTYSDGGIYFLPSASPEENTHRDVWLINKIYLDQLGLKSPTSLTELTNYFRAVKANAGKGNIPANVIPFYYMFKANANASFEDIYAAFGLTQGLRWGPYIEDGKVKHNLTNKALVEAVKYQAMLYAEGLTSPQAFTDDSAAMTLYLQSTNPTMTGFLSYNDNRSMAHWVHIAPVTGPNGTKTFTRTRSANVLKGCVVFKKCEYPAAVVRFFQYVNEDKERWITLLRGQKGAAWEYDEKSNVKVLVSSIANLQEKDRGFTQTALIQSKELFDWYMRKQLDDPSVRPYWYKNLYDNYLPPANISLYPGIPSCFSSKAVNDKNTEISTNVWSYANEILANWVMGKGNIDAEWSGFVAKINGYGWETYLKNLQTTYDAFMVTLK